VVSPRGQYSVQSYSTSSSMTWMKSEYTLSVSVDDTKMGEVADTPEDCAAIQ